MDNVLKEYHDMKKRNNLMIKSESLLYEMFNVYKKFKY